MGLSLKSGVRLHGLSSPMLVALSVVADIYREMGFDCVVTAGIDGKHIDGSYHYSGNALDFRTNNIPGDQHAEVLKRIHERLNEDFFAQIEVDHIHIQFHPKATYTGA